MQWLNRIPMASGGIALAISAVMFSTLLDSLLKTIVGDIGVWQAAAIRWLMGALLFLPMAIKYQWFSGFKLSGIHGVRLVLNMLGGFGFLYALIELPLVLVIAIYFTEPLFSVLFARFIFAEKTPVHRYLAIVAGFVGVLLMLQPEGIGSMPDPFAVVMSFIGAASWGLMNVLTRHYGRDIATGSLVFWLALLTGVASLPMAVADWQPISANVYGLLLAAAIAGSLFNVCWTRSFKLAPVAVVAGVYNLTLPLAALVGWLVFGEVPGVQMVVGAAIVLGAVFWACKE